MTSNLYTVLGGMNVKFPVQYRSDYVDPSLYKEMNEKAAAEQAEREKGNWSTLKMCIFIITENAKQGFTNESNLGIKFL